MEDNNEIIDGGCILLSRHIMQSEIWRKPPEWLKIFLYILLKVNHKNGLFERGSNFFNFSEERPTGVSYNQVREFFRWATNEKIQFCTKQKTTRGVIVKVNNYDRYQTLDNYYKQDEKQNENKTDTKQTQNRHTMINKNERMKECNNIISMEKRKKEKTFIPPTLEEIKKYCAERNNNVDPQKFFDYYAVLKWKDSKGKPVKNWKQKIIAVWENKKENQITKKSNNFYMSLSKE